ncbi:hypothetical protein B0H16DRAFT_1736997 [Mycena metata]|uniref:Uncharacterized protein n=1 Tax=Mycena metata TaxID=1033252 RepID=A0AAD7MM59_9AGAR|nr:hypothetical protein B0H16DRAFT_1736997 [Mycena metata]
MLSKRVPLALAGPFTDAIHICAIVAPCIYHPYVLDALSPKIGAVRGYLNTLAGACSSVVNSYNAYIPGLHVALGFYSLLISCLNSGVAATNLVLTARSRCCRPAQCSLTASGVPFLHIGGGFRVNGKFPAKAVVPHVTNDHDIDNLANGSFMFEYQCSPDVIQKNPAFIAAEIPFQNLLYSLTRPDFHHTAPLHRVRILQKFTL